MCGCSIFDEWLDMPRLSLTAEVPIAFSSCTGGYFFVSRVCFAVVTADATLGAPPASDTASLIEEITPVRGARVRDCWHCKTSCRFLMSHSPAVEVEKLALNAGRPRRSERWSSSTLCTTSLRIAFSPSAHECE